MTRFIQIKSVLFTIFCLLFLISGSINAQNEDTKYGKILAKSDADQQFGAVLEFVSISTNTLHDLLGKSEKTVMFKIIDKELYVLNNNREVIYPAGGMVASDVKLAVYSISVISKLIADGNQSSTQVEQRSEVLSITNGNQTLEYSSWCPPLCQ